METTTLGGGCFWCLEAAFAQTYGVHTVTSGYAGGHTLAPTYTQVCTGTTGHAEVVQIPFLPEIISFNDLLTIFFALHDPTTLNRQGADVGTQYRSVIFYHTDLQKEVSLKMIQAMKAMGRDAVTEVSPLDRFYPAEAYHQRYYERNPYNGYCQAVIAPKIEKLRKQFLSKLKKPS